MQRGLVAAAAELGERLDAAPLGVRIADIMLQGTFEVKRERES